MKQKERVKLTVADNGKGIAQKYLPHIFERYYRVDKATKGTGLGLSIAAKLVARHEGSIKVKSRVNQGTVFTVILPVKVS